jgi:hypothetical protein
MRVGPEKPVKAPAIKPITPASTNQENTTPTKASLVTPVTREVPSKNTKVPYPGRLVK